MIMMLSNTKQRLVNFDKVLYLAVEQTFDEFNTDKEIYVIRVRFDNGDDCYFEAFETEEKAKNKMEKIIEMMSNTPIKRF